jgi:hypothetical protein
MPRKNYFAPASTTAAADAPIVPPTNPLNPEESAPPSNVLSYNLSGQQNSPPTPSPVTTAQPSNTLSYNLSTQPVNPATTVADDPYLNELLYQNNPYLTGLVDSAGNLLPEYQPDDTSSAAIQSGLAAYRASLNQQPTAQSVSNPLTGTPNSNLYPALPTPPTGYESIVSQTQLTSAPTINLTSNGNQISSSTPNSTSNVGVLTYPNGSPVIDPNTNQPYPRPSGLNVEDNVALGEGATPIDMLTWFYHGRPMDYQRLGGAYNGNYRNVTNYNYGAVSAAAGYSLEDALNNAGTYNRYFGNPKPTDTRYGIKQDAINNITQGWNDYKTWKPTNALPSNENPTIFVAPLL